MSRYLVVQFINSKDGLCYFDVVPKEWRINDRTCYWPIDWSYKKIRDAVKKRIALDIDWSVNQYVKIANTFTFEEADFLAERELLRYNKRVKRKQLEEIKKEIEDEEEECDSSSGSDSDSDSSSGSSISTSSSTKSSCKRGSNVSDCTNRNESLNASKDQPPITVMTEGNLNRVEQNARNELEIECPQLSLSDEPYIDTDNDAISRLINEPCSEINFASDLS